MIGDGQEQGEVLGQMTAIHSFFVLSPETMDAQELGQLLVKRVKFVNQ